MLYEYECPKCKRVFEVQHPLSEIGNLSEENKKKTTCPDFGLCENNNKEQVFFEKVINTAPDIGKWGSLNNVQKQQILAKRSKEDFKKNVEEKKRVMQNDSVSQLRNIVGKK